MKGRIIKKDGKYIPQQYAFLTWWDFTYDRIVGGCNLGLGVIEFSTFSGAQNFLAQKEHDIVTTIEEEILRIEKNIKHLKESLSDEELELQKLRRENGKIRNTI